MKIKHRWKSAQKKEQEFWLRDEVFDYQLQRVEERYKPALQNLSGELSPEAKILDLGCGPTCAGRFFKQHHKVFLDPLMDLYLEKYSDRLPEGEKISSTAENIPEKNNTFDAVICMNALDHMENPEKVLLEVERVLTDEGFFCLGLFLHCAHIAKVRMFIEKYLPLLGETAHPYSYSLKSIRELLSRHFSLIQEIKVYHKDGVLFPGLHREDWIFTCRKKVKTAARKKKE